MLPLSACTNWPCNCHDQRIRRRPLRRRQTGRVQVLVVRGDRPGVIARLNLQVDDLSASSACEAAASAIDACREQSRLKFQRRPSTAMPGGSAILKLPRARRQPATWRCQQVSSSAQTPSRASPSPPATVSAARSTAFVGRRRGVSRVVTKSSILVRHTDQARLLQSHEIPARNWPRRCDSRVSS